LIWLESITSFLARILLEILIMTDFGRQACLNGRPFETLAQAIARKDPKDTQAIISFEPDAVTGEAAPSDLFHDEIEKRRASAEAYLARARQRPSTSARPHNLSRARPRSQIETELALPRGIEPLFQP
jgi:hypothetical protein